LSVLIDEIGNLRSRRLLLLERHRLVLRKMDERIWASLAGTDGGVDKLDFVCGMLTKLDLVSKADIDVFMKQFEQLASMKPPGEPPRLNRADLSFIANGYITRGRSLIDESAGLTPRTSSDLPSRRRSRLPSVFGPATFQQQSLAQIRAIIELQRSQDDLACKGDVAREAQLSAVVERGRQTEAGSPRSNTSSERVGGGFAVPGSCASTGSPASSVGPSSPCRTTTASAEVLLCIDAPPPPRPPAC